MSDDSFEKLLEVYSHPSEPNPDMVDVEIVWIRDNRRLGSLHISEPHGVHQERGASEREVEEVLLRIPPYVKTKRIRTNKARIAFWGATNHDRWLVVICEEKRVGNKRYLTPITAFEPTEGEDYWRKL